jgi:hypothetical protein
MMHNSQEWHEKMAHARRYASRYNKRMAVVGHQVSYRGQMQWHYVVMTITMAQATGHLRRPPVTRVCACPASLALPGQEPLWCELQEGHSGNHRASPRTQGVPSW